MRKIPASLLVLALAVAVSACGGKEEAANPAEPAGAPSGSLLSRGVQAAMEQAARKLETENISIGGRHSNGFRWGEDTDHLPTAEITPKGDLLVEGKAVPLDDAQREQVLAYRAQVLEIARAGMAVGLQGADLGVQAATGALKAVFGGTTEEFEKRMEAEGQRIEQQAREMVCGRLPGLQQAQQSLAAAVPEFTPYATLGADDIENCGKEDGSRSFQVQAGGQVFDVIPDADSADVAAEADAAAAGQATQQ